MWELRLVGQNLPQRVTVAPVGRDATRGASCGTRTNRGAYAYV